MSSTPLLNGGPPTNDHRRPSTAANPSSSSRAGPVTLIMLIQFVLHVALLMLSTAEVSRFATYAWPQMRGTKYTLLRMFYPPDYQSRAEDSTNFSPYAYYTFSREQMTSDWKRAVQTYFEIPKRILDHAAVARDRPHGQRSHSGGADGKNCDPIPLPTWSWTRFDPASVRVLNYTAEEPQDEMVAEVGNTNVVRVTRMSRANSSQWWPEDALFDACDFDAPGGGGGKSQDCELAFTTLVQARLTMHVHVRDEMAIDVPPFECTEWSVDLMYDFSQRGQIAVHMSVSLHAFCPVNITDVHGQEIRPIVPGDTVQNCSAICYECGAAVVVAVALALLLVIGGELAVLWQPTARLVQHICSNCCCCCRCFRRRGTHLEEEEEQHLVFFASDPLPSPSAFLSRAGLPRRNGNGKDTAKGETEEDDGANGGESHHYGSLSVRDERQEEPCDWTALAWAVLLLLGLALTMSGFLVLWVLDNHCGDQSLYAGENATACSGDGTDDADAFWPDPDVAETTDAGLSYDVGMLLGLGTALLYISFLQYLTRARCIAIGARITQLTMRDDRRDDDDDDDNNNNNNKDVPPGRMGTGAVEGRAHGVAVHGDGGRGLPHMHVTHSHGMGPSRSHVHTRLLATGTSTGRTGTRTVQEARDKAAGPESGWTWWEAQAQADAGEYGRRRQRRCPCLRRLLDTACAYVGSAVALVARLLCLCSSGGGERGGRDDDDDGNGNGNDASRRREGGVEMVGKDAARQGGRRGDRDRALAAIMKKAPGPGYYGVCETLSAVLPQITRLAFEVSFIYVAFAIVGVAAFSQKSPRFGTLTDAMMTLFAMVNGDVLRETVVELSTKYGSSIGPALFVVLYVVVLMYVGLNALLVVIEMAFVRQQRERQEQQALADVGGGVHHAAPAGGGQQGERR